MCDVWDIFLRSHLSTTNMVWRLKCGLSENKPGVNWRCVDSWWLSAYVTNCYSRITVAMTVMIDNVRGQCGQRVERSTSMDSTSDVHIFLLRALNVCRVLSTVGLRLDPTLSHNAAIKSIVWSHATRRPGAVQPAACEYPLYTLGNRACPSVRRGGGGAIFWKYMAQYEHFAPACQRTIGSAHACYSSGR